MSKRARKQKRHRKSAPTVEQWLKHRKYRRIGTLLGLMMMIVCLFAVDRAGWIGPLLGSEGRAVDQRLSDLRRFQGRAIEVERVGAGLTFDVIVNGSDQRCEIRLLGIATPESSSQAAALARRLLADQRVKLHLDQAVTRDALERLRADLVLGDGSSLTERLLLAGAVRVASNDASWTHARAERFTLLQRQARVEGLGMWGANHGSSNSGKLRALPVIPWPKAKVHRRAAAYAIRRIGSAGDSEKPAIPFSSSPSRRGPGELPKSCSGVSGFAPSRRMTQTRFATFSEAPTGDIWATAGTF